MAWGKRTAPPTSTGGTPAVMCICDDCTALTGIVFSDPPRGARSITVCEACGKECNYLLWELSQDQWFKLEVQLAVKAEKEESDVRQR